ncbi:MAG: hypothetical protein AAF490_12185 [Chloroflexota bacterium]
MFEQDRLLVRLQQRVMAEMHILACFMSGSYGKRQEDAYSDMDVALVFRAGYQREDAWAKRREFVRSITPYVPAKSFDGSHIRPFFHVALYSNGTKVDFRYELQAEMTPNPWDRDLRILKDSDGWVEQYQASCAQMAHLLPRIDREQLVAIDDRFWVMFWDIFRLVLRGESDKPFPIYLELMHSSLPPLLDQLPEGSAERNGLLLASFNQKAPTTKQHLKQLLSAYVAARDLIVQKQHLDVMFDTKFETAVKALVERYA